MKGSERPDDDDAAFAEAVRDVKPLPPHNIADLRSSRSRTIHKPMPPSAGSTVDDDNGGATNLGVPQTVLRRLRNGQIPIEAELDLHGATVEQAHERLRIFLQSSRTDRQRAVRVIHGKGRGSPNQQSILRTRVNEWLHQTDGVLAFCPAGPTDGGSGAVRVLLKRRPAR